MLKTHKKVNLSGSEIKILFCPEDNCEKNIITELNEAKKNISILAFSFTSEAIGKTLVELKEERNINITTIFEKTRISKFSEYELLKKHNTTTMFDGNKYTMHEKMIIIDDSTLIVGSYNPTKNANTLNDENILIIKHNDELIFDAKREFERIKNESLSANKSVS
jgi:phospholipase D